MNTLHAVKHSKHVVNLILAQLELIEPHPQGRISNLLADFGCMGGIATHQVVKCEVFGLLHPQLELIGPYY